MFRPVCFSVCQWHPGVVEINKRCGRRGKGVSTDPSKTNKTSKVANDGAVTAVKPSDQFSFSSRVSSFPCCPSLPKPTHIILICLFDLSTPKQPFRYPIVPLFARHILVPSTPGDMLPFYQIAGNAVGTTFVYHMLNMALNLFGYRMGDVHSIVFFGFMLMCATNAFRSNPFFDQQDMEKWSRLTTLFLFGFQKKGLQLFNLVRSKEWLQLCTLCFRLAFMCYSTGNVLGGLRAM